MVSIRGEISAPRSNKIEIDCFVRKYSCCSNTKYRACLEKWMKTISSAVQFKIKKFFIGPWWTEQHDNTVNNPRTTKISTRPGKCDKAKFDTLPQKTREIFRTFSFQLHPLNRRSKSRRFPSDPYKICGNNQNSLHPQCAQCMVLRLLVQGSARHVCYYDVTDVSVWPIRDWYPRFGQWRHRVRQIVARIRSVG